MRRSLAFVAVLAAVCCAATARAAEVSGMLPDPGVAWVSDGSHPAAMPEMMMRNTHKTFVPDLLVITAGTNVRFPNDDDFFHSIYSDSLPDPFDIGFYDNGPGKLVPFAKAGVNGIRCHIHGSMHGTIVVVDGPWAQTTMPNEKYVVHGVRPGEHELHVWTLTGGEKISRIKV